MLIAKDKSNSVIASNRNIFLKKHNINIKHTTRVGVTYQTIDYKKYRNVGKESLGKGMTTEGTPPADALVTRDKNHALFLPIADCVGTVIFDPIHEILMLSHLGRHSLEQFGGKSSIEFIVNNYNSDPSNLKIWLSPAPGKENYPVFAFNNKSLKKIAIEQLQSAGILLRNIVDNPADTTNDDRYYSHSEYLKGKSSEDGRFAIVAMMG